MIKLYKKLFTALACSVSLTALGSYSITPISVTIKPEVKVASLTFKNDSKEEKSFQLTVLHQNMGHEEYKESKDLIATPSIFKVSGEGSQLIRVAIRNDLAKEGNNYRLSIKELPAKVPVKGHLVAIVPDFRIPVRISSVDITEEAMPTERQAETADKDSEEKLP